LEFYPNLQNGEDYINKKGTIVPNEEVTFQTPKKSYAFCSDTVYEESLIEKIKGADLLYHETTYLKAYADRALLHFHSTTVQAATIAKKAGVKKLIIGHFSSKYEVLDEFLNETSEVFPDTELALQGVCFKV
jgi:ribonuclease Z